MTVNIKLEQTNKLRVSCSDNATDARYLFKFYRNGEYQERSYVQDSLEYVYWLTEEGSYQVEVVIINDQEERESFWSQTLVFEGVHLSEKERKKESVLQSIQYVLCEIWENRSRLWRIALYDYKIRDKDSYLGKLWRILNPLIQIATFWLVFGEGIRRGQAMGEHPYLIWMLTGLLPWFFINACIVGGAGSVYAKAGTVLRLRYPISTIPVSYIITAFFDFLITMAILLILMLCYGYCPNLYWLNTLYYTIYSVVFLSLLAMVTSTLTMIARDFQKLIQSLMRLLFYMTPILWQLESMPYYMRNILQFNPMLYIVDGFRNSLLYGVSFLAHPQKMLVFWLLNLFLLVIGCQMQRKFKDQFIDLL